MKSVCVVTWFDTWNYGTQLQATALCKYIEKLGYKTYILKRFAVKEHFIKHPQLALTRLDSRINRKRTDEFFHKYPYKISAERRRRITEYTEEIFDPVVIDTTEKWEKIVKSGMIFVSGSDIIWNPNIGHPGMFFLDFAMYDNLTRISYASSTGAKRLPKSYYDDYRRVMKGFTAISTREKNSADFFTRLLRRPVEKVIDPTLLHDSDFWDTIAETANISIETARKYILCYFVFGDKRYWDYVELIRQQYSDYDIIVLPMNYEAENSGFKVIDDGTPREFISLIKGAEFIVTDSFHAAVFSFIYDKEYYILKRSRSDEDEKFSDLLNRYGMTDRMITDEQVFIRKPDIDYSDGKKRLESDRAKSIRFLRNALRGHKDT